GSATEVGRKVSSLAYAWYARGVYHEGQGDWERAALAFEVAIHHDEKSGAAWASLGRVLCNSEPQRATEVFSRGLRKAQRIAPIYLEKNRCKLQHERSRGASNTRRSRSKSHQHVCVDAERAFSIEPDNVSVSRFL